VEQAGLPRPAIGAITDFQSGYDGVVSVDSMREYHDHSQYQTRFRGNFMRGVDGG
jgi:hypothetical protein